MATKKSKKMALVPKMTNEAPPPVPKFKVGDMVVVNTPETHTIRNVIMGRDNYILYVMEDGFPYSEGEINIHLTVEEIRAAAEAVRNVFDKASDAPTNLAIQAPSSSPETEPRRTLKIIHWDGDAGLLQIDTDKDRVVYAIRWLDDVANVFTFQKIEHTRYGLSIGPVRVVSQCHTPAPTCTCPWGLKRAKDDKPCRHVAALHEMLSRNVV